VHDLRGHCAELSWWQGEEDEEVDFKPYGE
jgi:hypothetical protein